MRCRQPLEFMAPVKGKAGGKLGQVSVVNKEPHPGHLVNSA